VFAKEIYFIGAYFSITERDVTNERSFWGRYFG